ncbi:aminoglycoside phosphotransferase [Streptosporangium sp. NPDC001559]|uniref:maltokinase N-terminal cap-like domain-containing protein n=1 Tax=Streptosporangium sp. NPDC001559 TaxID=3366187 RepID=UPI0036EA9203
MTTWAGPHPDLGSRLAGPLAAWLPTQRWFASKGRAVRGVSTVWSTALPGAAGRDGPGRLLLVVEVTFADGGPAELYQLPLSLRGHAREDMGPIGATGPGGPVAHDGLRDPELVGGLLAGVLSGGRAGGNGGLRHGLRLTAVDPSRLPVADPVRPPVARLVDAEQSNSSVVLGERVIMKVFRRLTPGLNPELEIHRALTGMGSRHVAPLLGAVEGPVRGRLTTLAVLHRFVPHGRDGWSAALDDLQGLHRGDGPPPFAAQARRLGRAVAAVHADLSRCLGGEPMDTAALERLSAGLRDRLRNALAAVPALRRHERAVRAAFSAVADLPPGAPTHRIHGDLHLGQTLRAADRWLLIDFEGEPTAPLRERTVPQSPLRDVAGMLRSFDYAARHHLLTTYGSPDGDETATRLAERWTALTREAFLSGYGERTGGPTAGHRDLLRAFEMEKAVYETVYESRFRPPWAVIPLGALDRLC